MPNQALHLKDTDALLRLGGGLGRFGEQLESQVRQAEAIIEREGEWINALVEELRKQMEIARRNVQKSRGALAQTRSAKGDNKTRDKMVDRANKDLADSEKTLEEIYRKLQLAMNWKMKISTEADNFQRTAQQMHKIAGTHVSKARSKLKTYFNHYREVHRNESIAQNFVFDTPGGHADATNKIIASQFQADLKQELQENGLESKDQVLMNGDTAEAAARIILKKLGMPDGSGGMLQLDEVLAGQYHDCHGIDLVGVAGDKPVIIEIKKRQNPDKDDFGKDGFDPDRLEPETLNLIELINHERLNNPAIQDKLKSTPYGAHDTEFSTEQMSELWVRDRWFKLIKNPKKREMLEKAGIHADFLDLEKLQQSAYSQAWQDILHRMTTVVVSEGKSGVSDALFRTAVFERGFNVVLINMDE